MSLFLVVVWIQLSSVMERTRTWYVDGCHAKPHRQREHAVTKTPTNVTDRQVVRCTPGAANELTTTEKYWSVRCTRVNARVSDNYYQTGCVARPDVQISRRMPPPIHLDSARTHRRDATHCAAKRKSDDVSNMHQLHLHLHPQLQQQLSVCT